MIDFARLRQILKDEEKNFYLIVTGDGSFNKASSIFLDVDGKVTAVLAYDLVRQYLDKLLSKKVEQGYNIVIVSADNQGVDTLANLYAVEKGYRYECVTANWDEYGKKAGWYRNEDLVSIVQRKPNHAGVIFWNCEDIYTRNIIYNTYLYNVPVKVYDYKHKIWLSQEYIKQVGDEDRRKAREYSRRKEKERNEQSGSD